MERGLAFKLRGTFEAQLGLDVLAMSANGLGRKAELRGDGARGTAGANQQEDLHFPIGQRGVAFVGRAAKPARKQARVHARGDGDVAPQHRREGTPGIATEDVPLLFKKFSRLRTLPTGGEPTTGLGLYIVRVLAERMGARASFAPNPDGGSVFFVDVPRPQ